MKYIFLFLVLLLFTSSSYSLEDSLTHTAYLSEEEVVFENVQMLKLGHHNIEYYISKLSTDGTLLCRYFSEGDSAGTIHICKSTDEGNTWSEALSFVYDSIYLPVTYSDENHSHMFIENSNLLNSISSMPNYSVDIERFQGSRSYDEFDTTISQAQIIAKKGDSLIRRYFYSKYFAQSSIIERSTDNGKTWQAPDFLTDSLIKLQINTGIIGDTLILAFINTVWYSTDYGHTWQENKQISAHIKEGYPDFFFMIDYIKKLSSGELFLVKDYYHRTQKLGFNKYLISSDGIKWQELDIPLKWSTSKLVDKPDTNTYVFKAYTRENPNVLIKNHNTYELPFPTEHIEYTKSGYWYYYDSDKNNFCRRKIVLK